MKIKNNKKIVTIVSITGAIALGTIGFAAWQINGNVPINDSSVNVSFGEVTSNTLTATEITEGTDKKISFDGSGDTTAPITSTEKLEDLQFVIKYSIKKESENALFTKLTFNFSDHFEELVTSNYIVRPYDIGESTLSIDSTTNSKTYYSSHTDPGTYNDTAPTDFAQKHTITKDSSFTTNYTYNVESTFVFKWGTTFGGKNPDQFDNETANAETVKAALQNFKTAYTSITDKTIKLTITPLDK